MAFLPYTDLALIVGNAMAKIESQNQKDKAEVNMNKIRIKSTPLFKQVAAVIGEERAQIELAIVCHAIPIHFNVKLNLAFYWPNSPQKDDFWCDISKGINPCNN